MANPAVPQVGLGSTHETLAQIASPRLKSADEQEINHEVEIAADRHAPQAQPSSERRSVEDLPLAVGEHRPEAPQRLSGDAGTELRHVAFQIGADEVEPPVKTPCVAVRNETLREAPAMP